jgi:hypothetical protein
MNFMNRRSEIETLRTEIELLKNQITQQSASSSEDSVAKDKRDRLVQSGFEYWKAQHDFFKHFMTISLASIATFGAVAAGLFGEVWKPNVIESYQRFGLVIISVDVVIAFAVAAIMSASGMTAIRNNIWSMKDVTNKEEFEKLRGRRYGHGAVKPWMTLDRAYRATVLLYFSGTVLFVCFFVLSIMLLTSGT